EIEKDKNMISANEHLLTQTHVQRGKYKQNIIDWRQKVETDKTLLADYQYYAQVFTKQKESLTAQKGNIAQELGVFEPKNSIKIASHNLKTADYFETLVHEYLHYASFVSEGKKLKDAFFEEGLTEYFARAAIKEG